MKMIYMYKKTLASRIFTIQFSDADLFAVHAVYGKAFKVSPVYACGQKCSGWFKKKKSSFQWRSKLRGGMIHLNFIGIKDEKKNNRSASCKHAGCARRRRISKSDFDIRKAHSIKIHFYMVEEGTKEIFYWHASPGSRILAMTVTVITRSFICRKSHN